MELEHHADPTMQLATGIAAQRLRRVDAEIVDGDRPGRGRIETGNGAKDATISPFIAPNDTS
jgi:hypothetical protein